MLQSVPSQAEGAVFGTLNPRMDQQARLVPITTPAAEDRPCTFRPVDRPQETERHTTGSIYTSADVFSSLCGEDSAGSIKPIPEWRTKPNHGLVTVIVDNWTPKSARSVPPSVTDHLTMWLSTQWAILFNQSAFARRKKRWAVVTARGTVIVLCNIQLRDRPVNPADMPNCCITDLTFDTADRLAIAANTPRVEHSRVPRQWTVCIRRADSVNVETDGDA